MTGRTGEGNVNTVVPLSLDISRHLGGLESLYHSCIVCAFVRGSVATYMLLSVWLFWLIKILKG